MWIIGESMSFNNVPPKVEVMGWNPQSLAGYMKKLKLSGCDKVVMNGRISGAQFMQMTDSDLQVFPTLYFPIITKIQSDINKEEQRIAFGHKSKAQKSQKQVFTQKEEVWDSDEFDIESENEYEGPDQEEENNSYICALTEPQIAEEQDRVEPDEGDYKLPASFQIRKPPRCPNKLQGSHSKVPSPVERTSRPPLPHPPTMNPFPQRPLKTPGHASQPNLHVDRSMKPEQPGPSLKDLPQPKGSTIKSSHSFTSKLPKPMIPRPRPSKLIPHPPVPTQPVPVYNSIPGSKRGLDPSWYGGRVTRHQAEVALREMNKDGAFVVRDSSQGSAEHPYTLMLLKQGKIYNIKIRNQGDSFFLGTGHHYTKSFPGVKEMITHHTNTPLQLIDATDQSYEAQSQCCLLHPAGR